MGVSSLTARSGKYRQKISCRPITKIFWSRYPTWHQIQVEETLQTLNAKMSDLSNKKRKRDGEKAGSAKKKVVIDAPASIATVSSVLRPKSCPPVIGMRRISLSNWVVCAYADNPYSKHSRNGNALEFGL